MGTASPYIVAQDLGCSYEDVMRHINEQHDIKMDETGSFKSEDDLLKKLASNMKTLDEWTSYVIATVQGPKDVDRAKVDMLVRLTQEVRKTVESIATLQGRMGPGDTVLQVQILNARVVDLTNTVLDVCCPDCRMKILESMEKKRLCQTNVPLLTVKPSTEKTTCSTPIL
jgi:hypothetical protein